MSKSKVNEEEIKNSVNSFECIDDIAKWQQRYEENATLLCEELENNIDSFKDSIERLDEVISAADELHKKGGQCFKITKKIFDYYSRWAYADRVTRIAYERAGFSGNGRNDGSVSYTNHAVDTSSDAFYLARVDIYDLLDDAEMGDYTCNGINSYMKSVKLSLHAHLVYLAERAVYIMTESSEATEESKDLGNFLKKCFLTTPEERGTIEDRMKRTGCTYINAYYKKMDDAISFASPIIFGFMPINKIDELITKKKAEKEADTEDKEKNKEKAS